MKIQQKSLLYRINAEVENSKLKYKRIYIFSKFEIKIDLLKINGVRYDQLYINWWLGALLIFLLVLDIVIGIQLIHKNNTFDSFLFYFIQTIFVLPLFVFSIKQKIIMQSTIGNIYFLKTPDINPFLEELENERRKTIIKYYTKFSKEIAFEEQLENITSLFRSEWIDDIEFKKYKDQLEECFSDNHNCVIGFSIE